MRIVVWPWIFRLPIMRRFDGYAAWSLILLREPLSSPGAPDLVCHELCHVWQMQRHPLRMPLSYLSRGYANNPYEAEARWATAQSAGRAPAPGDHPRGIDSTGSWPWQRRTGTRG